MESLNAYELMKAMIEAGAAGVHFEDQLSSAKKCRQPGGKVVVPTREFIEKLVAACLAADVCGVPTILIARTDANSAGLLLSDADLRDRAFIHAERTPEGFYQFRGGIAVTHQRASWARAISTKSLRSFPAEILRPPRWPARRRRNGSASASNRRRRMNIHRKRAPDVWSL